MKKLAITSIAIGAVMVFAPIASAATTADSKLTQLINAGTLSTSITNASGSPVPDPSFAMSAVNVSTAQQTSTGKFGSETQRIVVDNPGGANNGWTLSLNATTPGTGKWTAASGGANYAYNGTAATGQLTVNPQSGSVNPTGSYNPTGITLGSQATFTGATPITLATAAAQSDDIWNGYFKDIDLTQTIPANTPAGTYTINMTQTVAAV